MSHTNVTPNFDLPQFTADDKPDWLVDLNAAFLAIDTGMEATQSEAESASSTAQLAQETAEGAAETAGQASSDVAGLTTDLETLQGTVNTVTALIGNGTPTTTDKTIIGAINEINAEVNPGSVEVVADGVKTQSALLDELFALIDKSKIGEKSKLEKQASTNKYYYDVAIVSTDIMVSGTALPTMSGVMTLGGTIAASGSTFGYTLIDGTPTVTITNESTTVLAAGTKFIFHY